MSNPQAKSIKERIIILCESGQLPEIFDQSHLSSLNLRASACQLTRCHEWRNRDLTRIRTVFVNLDDILTTQSLDHWAIQAWKETLNSFLINAMDPQGHVPQLVGYTRTTTWDNAVLGVKLGMRDLVKFSRISEKLSSHQRERVDSQTEAKIIPFPSTQDYRNTERRETSRHIIPHYEIPFPIDGLEGNSVAIENIKHLIRRSAPLETPILITGETGTGKELVAKAIHRHSHRAQGPFIVLNCSAIPKTLIEAELFGYVKGAFTGAEKERMGLLESANGGTLYLDEVNAIAPELQVKLLRALQEATITRLGDSAVRPLDFRLISSTTADISELGLHNLRDDFLFRIKVLEIPLPSLKEHMEDLSILCEFILRKIAKKNRTLIPEIANDALEVMKNHDWPGNIRELENALEYASTLVISENRRMIHTSDLPYSVNHSTKSKPSAIFKEAVQKFEYNYIQNTINRLGGDKEKAAKVLGLSLATLYRKWKKE